jgi:hypothetical protein
MFLIDVKNVGAERHKDIVKIITQFSKKHHDKMLDLNKNEENAYRGKYG